MPHKSLRLIAIEHMKLHVHKLKKAFILWEVMDDINSVLDAQHRHVVSVSKKMINSHYLFRAKSYCKNRNKFDFDNALSDENINFNNEEFLYYFQITRESFFLLFEQLAKTNAFICISWIKPQCPIASQILVFLYHKSFLY